MHHSNAAGECGIYISGIFISLKKIMFVIQASNYCIFYTQKNIEGLQRSNPRRHAHCTKQHKKHKDIHSLHIIKFFLCVCPA